MSLQNSVLMHLPEEVSRLITQDALSRASKIGHAHTSTLLVAFAAAIAHSDRYQPGFDTSSEFEQLDGEFLSQLLDAAEASEIVKDTVFKLLDHYSIRTANETDGKLSYLILPGAVPIPMNASESVAKPSDGYICPYLWILSNLRTLASYPYGSAREIVEAHKREISKNSSFNQILEPNGSVH